MFRTAVSTFRSGERIFCIAEHTYRNAEYKPNTVQRYIKTGYYANICTTILIHLQLFNRQHLFSNYYSLTHACVCYIISYFLSLLSPNIFYKRTFDMRIVRSKNNVLSVLIPLTVIVTSAPFLINKS